jgi:hypothetical protein
MQLTNPKISDKILQHNDDGSPGPGLGLAQKMTGLNWLLGSQLFPS